jgi:hypothetical protein
MMNFRDLNWPKGLNLDLLLPIVPQAMLLNFVLENATNNRRKRRIILPSQCCVKKVVAHFFGTQVEHGSLSWDDVMLLLKGKHRYLLEVGLSLKEIKRLYKKRCSEIENEK